MSKPQISNPTTLPESKDTEDKRKLAREVHTNHFTNRGDNRAKTETVK